MMAKMTGLCANSVGISAVLMALQVTSAADALDDPCDLTLPPVVELYRDMHQEHQLTMRRQSEQQFRASDSAQKFREVLAGLGYILSGDLGRLDHLSRPPEQPCDVHSNIGYDSQLNERMLFKAHKREGEKTQWLLFETDINEWQ